MASGRWRDCDDAILGDNRSYGTVRNFKGQYTGRVIDFGLASPGVIICGRSQFVGLADHDGVSYDILLDGADSHPWKLPPCPTLSSSAVSLDAWIRQWDGVQPSFCGALTDGNVDLAWRLLSNCVEVLLGTTGKTGRADRQGPQQIASPPSTKAPSFQTLRERRLRRSARRVNEFQTQCAKRWL